MAYESKATLAGAVMLALLVAVSAFLVGATGVASATPKAKIKYYDVETTIAVVPLATEGNLVSMTIEGTLTSAKPACIRGMVVEGSYGPVGSLGTSRQNGGRNFGPATSDAQGHWSAVLTHVSPLEEREVYLVRPLRRLNAHMVCGTTKQPRLSPPADRHHYRLTF